MRRLSIVLVLLALSGAGIAVGSDPLHAPLSAKVSILAVGDTGRPWHRFQLSQVQRSVGQALAAEDGRSPVDALLLLGDNFYFSGLVADTIVKRVRENLTEPYCPFVAQDAARYREVAGSCADAPLRHARPIYAVLGNHDAGAESAALESGGVDNFVSNWDLPPGIAAVRELSDGVSLVLVDSNALREGRGAAELRDALRDARGPWRIVAMHHPIGAAAGDARANDPVERAYRELVLGAVADAGVPVQVYLSGHIHNLQLLALPGNAGLQVVAGAGGATLPIRGVTSQRRFVQGNSPGFARVDLVGVGASARLVVSIYEVSRYGWLLHDAPEVAASLAVDVTGRISGDGVDAPRAAADPEATLVAR